MPQQANVWSKFQIMKKLYLSTIVISTELGYEQPTYYAMYLQ